MTQSLRKPCFELRSALDHLYLSQTDLARMVWVKRLQVWRWCDGKAEVPDYVWCLLSAIEGTKIADLREKRWHHWKVLRPHVYRGGVTHRELAKRFHPDISGRDTTAEMQLINAMRK